MTEELKAYPIATIPHVCYLREGPHNPVSLGELWTDNGRRTVISTDRLLEEACMLPGTNGWFQLLYNSRSAAIALLERMPADPEPKLIALPEFAWDLVRHRWPSLHFNDHFLFQALEAPPLSSLDDIVEVLTLDDLSYLWEHQPYIDEYGGKGYLAQRLRLGMAVGLRVDGELGAWVLEQEDGILGFLRVRKRYRRQGLGLKLISHMARRIMQKGKNALGHVSTLNTASLKIAGKLTVKIVARESWVRRRTREEIDQYRRGIF